MTFAAPIPAPDMPADRAFQVTLLEDRDQLCAWADRWRSLESVSVGSGGVFQSFDWLRPMMNLTDRQPCVVALEDARGPAVIAPFSLVSWGGLQVLEWLGEPMLAYGDLLARADVDVIESLGRGLAFLQQKGRRLDALHLRKVREDAAIAPFLRKMGAPCGSSRSPHTDLREFPNFEAFLASRNKRSMKGYRRRSRRLAEEGKLHFWVHRAGPEAQTLARKGLDLKLEWMRAQGRVSRTFSSAARLEALIAGVGEQATGACVSGLFLNERPLAIEIGYIQNSHYYSFMGAMDLDYSANSPGNLQIMETMRWCFNQGITVFDFLPPESDYKRSWATGDLGLSDYCFAFTPLGRLYSDLYVKSLHPLLLRAQAGAPSFVRGLSNLWLSRKGGKMEDA